MTTETAEAIKRPVGRPRKIALSEGVSILDLTDEFGPDTSDAADRVAFNPFGNYPIRLITARYYPRDSRLDAMNELELLDYCIRNEYFHKDWNIVKGIDKDSRDQHENVRQPYESPVALVMDYHDLWAIQIQPHRQNFGYLRHLFIFYQALTRLGTNVDIVSPQADFSGYKLLISPTALLGDSTLATRFMEYTDQGGMLLLGVRSGFNTPSKIVVDQPLPGPFRDLAGVSVKTWHSLPPGIGFTLGSEIQGLSGQATVWVEALNPRLTQLKRW